MSTQIYFLYMNLALCLTYVTYNKVIVRYLFNILDIAYSTNNSNIPITVSVGLALLAWSIESTPHSNCNMVNDDPSIAFCNERLPGVILLVWVRYRMWWCSSRWSYTLHYITLTSTTDLKAQQIVRYSYNYVTYPRGLFTLLRILHHTIQMTMTRRPNMVPIPTATPNSILAVLR